MGLLGEKVLLVWARDPFLRNVVFSPSQGVVVICSDGFFASGRGWFLLLALTRQRIEGGGWQSLRFF